MKKKEIYESDTAAIILAAGSSTRMQGKNKLFEIIGEQTVIIRSLKIFEQNDRISEIVVVTKEEVLPQIKELIKTEGLKKCKKIVLGGATRQESVLNGINATNIGTKYIAIHDGARPFVSENLLDELLIAVDKYNACIPAIPLSDTIKEVSGEIIVKTPDRSRLFAAQTPQIFLSELFIKASKYALSIGYQGTDDASIVEKYGVDVRIIEGETTNIKITNPFDLEIGKIISKKRRQKKT